MLQGTAKLVSGWLGRDSTVVRSLRPAYESVLGWTSGGRGIPWVINGVEYRIDPHHRHRLGSDYDPTVAKFLRAHVRDGQTCFDIGANVGAYVLQLAHWTRPSGRIVAFEPNRWARAVLEHHVQLNGMNGRVTIVPGAVGRESGNATIYAAGADGMSRLNAPNVAIADRAISMEVSVVSVDDYVRQSKVTPDVVMIDIEGFEIAALAGAKRLIQERRDLLIVAEMHPDIWSSADTTRESAERLLNELQLVPVPLEGQSDPLADHATVHLKQRERV
jgi:FkbM family methyltransferase